MSPTPIHAISLGLFLTTSLAVSAPSQEQWVIKAPASHPSARDGHVMGFHAASGKVILFGGWDGVVSLGDTWEWDGRTWRQLAPQHSPSPRAGQRACYDSLRGRLVMYGGWDNANTILNDTWEWDGTDWLQGPSSPPSMTPRYEFEMAYDTDRAKVIVLGGCYDPPPMPQYQWCRVAFLDDMWTYDGQNWALAGIGPRNTTGPYWRQGFGMAYDESRHRLVVVGGWYNDPGNWCIGADRTDVWEWDGTSWALGSTQGSLPVGYGLSATYDPVQHCIAVFSNWHFPAWSGFFWRYDGSTWQAIGYPGPSTTFHYLGVITYDWARQRTLRFGGYYNNTLMDETRVYGLTVPATRTTRGAGCASSGPAPILNSTSVPDLGNSAFACSLTGSTPQALHLFVVSLATASSHLTPTCTLLVDTNLLLTTAVAVSDTTGVGTFTLPIPFDNGLIGLPLHAQGAVFGASGPYLGLSLSNALAMRVGD